MSLKERINEDMKAAMRAKQAERLGAIRLLMAAMKQKEVDERIALDDAGIVSIIDKMIKQRKDSIAAFRSGKREDLALKEEAELAVLQPYLPARLEGEALDAEIKAVIAEVRATSAADMGKVMGPLKARLAGKADMGAASARVKALLAS